jgi:hypothetical protein
MIDSSTIVVEHYVLQKNVLSTSQYDKQTF